MFNELLDQSGQAAGENDEAHGQKPAESPMLLPILPLRGMVVYPLAALPLRAAQPRAVRLIDDAILRKSSIGMIASKAPHKEDPGIEDIHTIGTIATIARQFKSADGIVNMIVQGTERFRIVQVVSQDPYIVARVELLPEPWENSLEIEALRRNLSEGSPR